eukprot:jgi/Botrbrau1/23526/Bobra.0418s0002.1
MCSEPCGRGQMIMPYAMSDVAKMAVYNVMCSEPSRKMNNDNVICNEECGIMTDDSCHVAL